MVRSLAAGGAVSGATAAQDAGSTVLYAGMAGTADGGASAGGHVFTNDTANAGVFNAAGFDVSSVVADAHDATGRTVYATIMGFSGNGDSVPHVYRSLDGGAHWMNLSSNLPNAPANALVVDPNDANTVYVAMDTCVYVTTSVSSCATANCWSVFGAGLPNAPVTTLAAGAALATGDGHLGLLRAGTYGRGIWSIPLVNTTLPTAPAMTVAPVSLVFAAQQVSTLSAAQVVTVTNSGTAPLTVSQIVATADFAETDTCVSGVPIAPGASCTVSVTFLPSAVGARTGVLTIYGDVAGGQATVQLSGTALAAPQVVLMPVTLSFATTAVGASSAIENVTVSNMGGTPATLTAPSITGDFAISQSTCGTGLAAGVGCTISVVFKPAASGARTGALTIGGSSGTLTASLSGTGVLPATDGLAPLSLVFATQQLNTASAVQTVTLTNAGDQALQLIAASIAAGDFTVANGCGNSLNGHASCTLQVAFVPKSLGAQAGVLTVSDQYRAQTVTLSGTGVAPPGVSVAPVGGVSFIAVAVGSSSAAQMVTLTNNGGLPLAVQSITASGDFSIPAGGSTCGATLAANAACTVALVFAPTSAGTRTGTLVLTDNAAGSPQVVALTGVGIDFTLAPNGSTTATLTAGQQAVYPLLLSSPAGVPGTVIFTCTPIPQHATCTVNPSSAGLGATTSVIVTVATSVPGAQLRWPLARKMAWLAVLSPVWWLRRRRGLAGLLLTLITALALGGMIGCGSARTIPGSDSTGSGGGGTATVPATPSGTYNLTVTGTSAGLTRSVGLTLVVQ
jgi:hypothetical protein